MEQRELTLAPESVGLRLDRWLAEQCPDLSRSQLQNLIEAGSVTCNGSPLNKKDKLNAGRRFCSPCRTRSPSKPSPRTFRWTLCMRMTACWWSTSPKAWWCTLRPATRTAPWSMHCCGTVRGGCPASAGPSAPALCIALIRIPAAFLVVAKTDAAHQALTEQMSVHSIHRVYHAVVYGNLKEDTGFVEAPIGRDPKDRKKMAVTQQNSKYAYTGWQVLERFGNFTYIACKLKTGRTHQIRVHMTSIGHPLAGDAVYGPKNCIRSLNGQCLHAKELGFVHPATGEWMQFDSSLPDWFQDYLSRLRKESRHGAFE